MTQKDEYKKLTMFLSEELLSSLDEASARLKISKGTLIRQAIEEFINKNKK